MIEAAGIITSLLGVYFSSQRHWIAWVWNIIASGIYMYVFYEAGLYSDMELQGLFIITGVYGLYQWRNVESTWRPEKSSLLFIVIGIVIAGLYGAGAGYFHENYTAQAKSPYWDASLTGLSLVGTYWASKRRIENWVLWIFVDCAYVAMYLVNGLWMTAGLYFVFVLMAIRGWAQWRKELKIN